LYFLLFFICSTQLDTNEFISIFLASVALTVLFDAPFQNLKKLLIKRPTAAKVVKDSKAKAAESQDATTTTLASQPSSTALLQSHHPHSD